MPLLIGCQEVSKAFSDRPLFDCLTLAIQDGDRVGLVGPNGTGKTTLLRILAGVETVDTGDVTLRQGAVRALVAQAPLFAAGATVRSVLEDGLADTGLDDAERGRRIGQALGRCGLADQDAVVERLSGGWRRRLAIAAALAREPDLLLLDEPTNHLDLTGVLWLEKLLLELRCATVVVSHDRYLLDRFPRRMIEVSRSYRNGTLTATGAYGELLAKKDAYLDTQAKHEDALRTRMRRELAWLRRGAKARTTKSKARIDLAGKIAAELDAVEGRNRGDRASIAFDATGRRSKRLLVAEGLALSRGGEVLFRDLDLLLRPGERLGLVGPNGCGKTSLLRTLLGQLPPDAGTLTPAEGLQAVYFDQHREGLDPELSLRRALAPEGDTVTYRGRGVHVASWARRFQFAAERLDVRVGMLSGGEVARVHIARLAARPADVLLLDEPTNDLDIATLEVLEESLESFPGAIVLVTHDRYLLDRLCTAVLGFAGAAVRRYADYDQWQSARAKAAVPVKTAAPPPGPGRKRGRKRLGYLEQREWDALPDQIEAAEAERAKHEAAIADPAIASDAGKLAASCAALEASQVEVDRLYERWSELEEKLSA